MNRRLECHRLAGKVYRLVAEADGATPLSHPDWPELTLTPAEICR